MPRRDATESKPPRPHVNSAAPTAGAPMAMRRLLCGRRAGVSPLLFLLLVLCTTARVLHAQTSVDRRLDIANEFFAHMHTGHLAPVDVQRLQLIEPYLTLSWSADERLSTVADSARQLMRMNAARYHLDILALVEEYCGTASRREMMLLRLQATVAADSEPAKRGLAGMIQGGRAIDRSFLGEIFRATTRGSVSSESPHANLLIKCHFQHERYTWTSLRLTTLDFDPYDLPAGKRSISSLLAAGVRLRVRNEHSGASAYVHAGRLRFSTVAGTQFTVAAHSDAPGAYHMLRVASADFLYVDGGGVLRPLAHGQSEADIARLRLFPLLTDADGDSGSGAATKKDTINAGRWRPPLVYLLDQDETPCVFFAMDNVSAMAAPTGKHKVDAAWGAQARLTAGYPPSALAYWVIEPFDTAHTATGTVLSAQAMVAKGKV